jgi:hypothetical protein
LFNAGEYVREEFQLTVNVAAVAIVRSGPGKRANQSGSASDRRQNPSYAHLLLPGSSCPIRVNRL